MAQSVRKKNSSRPYRVKDRKNPPSESRVLAARVGWIALGILWMFLLAGLVSFDASDAPSHAVWPHNAEVANWTGPIGAHIAYSLLRVFGIGIAIPMVYTGILLTLRIIARPMTQPIVRGFGVLILTTAVCVALNVIFPTAGALPGLVGGTIGFVGAAEMLPRFAMGGTMLWIVLFTATGLLVSCDRYLWTVPMAIWEKMTPALSHSGTKASEIAGQTATRINASTSTASTHSRRAGSGLLSGLASMLRKAKPVQYMRANDIDNELVEVKPEQPAPKQRKPKRIVRPVPMPVEEIEDENETGAPQVFNREDLKAKIAKLPVRFAQHNKQLATDDDLADFQNAMDLKGYRFPGMDLLEEPEIGFNERLESLVRGQAEALESSLTEYKINGEVVDIESGPAITLYHIRLAPGTKVAQINAIESDLARSLKAVNIRVVANMAGRDTIGIEVPNPTKERVRLKELMSNHDRFKDMKLPMFLGKDAAGEPLISDLTKMPHMLIAGTTGSGKSVCMNTIIMSFLYTKKPNELKLILVDPKMVEMSQFKDIPHLMCPVVTEMPKAAAILEWAVTKMDERYELLADAGCRDITGYNELEWDELKERLEIETDEQAIRIPKKLPYMVFIIDELADLMMTNKEVESSIIRIAQKARAVGIHLILATQRPQANVVTGLIKSHMPCRIAFKVASGMDSRIVLDQKGGELLLGQGDMLHLSPSSTELSRAQGTLVDDKEIRRVVKFLKTISTQNFERSLVQIKSNGDPDDERLYLSDNNSSASLKAAQEDPLFDRAVEIVLETKRGSVSLLQRRLAIGYTRSSRLIDLMGIAGIISDHKGSVARDVKISIEEWEAMKQLVAEEAEGGSHDPQDPHQEMMFESEEAADEDEDSQGEEYEGDTVDAPFEADGESSAAVVVHATAEEDQEYEEEEEPEDEVEDEYEEEEEEPEDELEVADEDAEEEEEEDEEAEEYEYVDEDGNPISPEELAEYETEEDEEEGEEAEDEYEEEECEEEEEELEPQPGGSAA
ncbi:MAG: DNA translocase FtsK 4TM domain-containing protein [Phycisphaerales bacterium]|nr:DNA translocase FtsK 4TM domain-containing protein [Phycisphaerales bacterium]